MAFNGFSLSMVLSASKWEFHTFMSRTRFIVYALVIVLVYQLTLWTKDRQSVDSTAQDKELFNYPRKRPSHPTSSHPPLPGSKRLGTAQERQKEANEAADKVRHRARQQFASLQVSGIPGTRIRTDTEAQTVHQTMDCWTQGTWDYDDKPRPLLRHWQDTAYGKCNKRFVREHGTSERTDQGAWNVREEVKYVWTPSGSCPPLKPMDRDRWCRLLQGRDILLVGDSLHMQLHDLLIDAFRDGPVVCFGELNCKDHTLCAATDPNDPKSASHLRYLRNDHLTIVSRHPQLSDVEHRTVNMIEGPWVTSNILGVYDIVILNRGSVYVDDDEFTKGLLRTIVHIRSRRPDLLIIYRSTHRGHLDCNNYTRPPQDESDINTNPDTQLPYHWSDFSRQNAIAREIVRAAGGLYVDVAALTDRRPDGHIGGRDCLRYCIPGPTDAWLTLLYNTFELL